MADTVLSVAENAIQGLEQLIAAAEAQGGAKRRMQDGDASAWRFKYDSFDDATLATGGAAQ